jgi:WD40 repeat protein
VTVDESGKLTVWDSKSSKKYAEYPKVTNGQLNTCSIESREGKLIACGGIDTKLHMFSINPSGKKKEKLTLIEKLKELSGHYGLVTCCSFLSQQFLVSGSNDSSLMLWDLEKPERFLVKYGDH